MNMVVRYFKLVGLLIVFALGGCNYIGEGILSPADRGAAIQTESQAGEDIDTIVYLDQNWDRWDSLWFYTTTQGSDLLPYDLFLALEQSDNEQLFRNAENMAKFRYLTQYPTKSNPDALPVGLVKDSYQGEEYLGFTCAACHTTQINYKGTGIRIDGGPALADMENFLIELQQALKATLTTPDKLERLVTQLAKPENEVFNSLDKTYRWFKQYNSMNAPINGTQMVHYGYGRLDAFGRIFNRVLHKAAPTDQENYNPPNAPVSYPYLWDTPHHDYVQWNGVGDNNEGPPIGFLGPLGRNVGEVLGVFSTFELDKQTPSIGYAASADKHNLARLERHLTRLMSPQWPEEILPKIDLELAVQGKQVFNQYRCDQCHSGGPDFHPRDSKRLIKTEFSSVGQIGTDPQMVNNAATYSGKTGKLKNQTISLKLKQEAFGDEAPALWVLTHAVENVIKARDPDTGWFQGRVNWLVDIVGNFFYNPVRDETDFKLDFEVHETFPDYLAGYKARPLNGIWATAPYLHNGSVPNLYELFLPSCNQAESSQAQACRSNTFTVGNREFDPVKVGFVSTKNDQTGEIFTLDTRIPGNLNSGHEYAAGKTPVIKLDANNVAIRNANGELQVEYLPPISDDQRWALVEYLKTL